MKTKQIEKFLLDYFGFEKSNKQIENTEDQVSAVQRLESERLISFSFEERGRDCDYYIAAETGVNINLDHKRFVGITFDYDVKLYDSETIEDFIEIIKDYNKTAIKIINKLKKIK